MSKPKSKSKFQLDFSPLYVICATGEDKVYQALQQINQKFSALNRFHLLQLPLQTGDFLLGYRHPLTANYQITESQRENLGTNTLNARPELEQVQPLYLIERKTVQDFCQSYRSQHYQNQKTRMLSYREQNLPCECMLVVEGYHQRPTSSFPRNFPKTTLESCFASIRLRDHFYVKHVSNTQQHAEFLHKCLRTIIRHQLYPTIASSIASSSASSASSSIASSSHKLAQDYRQTVAVKKKTNMNPALCYQVQLTAIPGISMNIAEIIHQHYSTISALLDQLRKEGPQALAKISLGKQKLGPAKSQRIYNYLLPTPTPTPSPTPTPTPTLSLTPK